MHAVLRMKCQHDGGDRTNQYALSVLSLKNLKSDRLRNARFSISDVVCYKATPSVHFVCQ